jgi:hypothetical protein
MPPCRLLGGAVTMREMTGARSPAEVFTWRIDTTGQGVRTAARCEIRIACNASANQPVRCYSGD